jgi:molybdopterin-guanine dinucleotide biosynthesis protein A
MTVLAAILAGGQSRRFGRDKALQPYRGRPLIDHAIDALLRQADALVLCGRRHRDLTMLDDLPRPGMGPLGGLAAALAFAERGGFEAVLSAPCDVPHLPVDLHDRLAAAGPAAWLQGCPVIGLWPASAAGALRTHLDTQADHSIRGFARAIGAVPIQIAGDLANINTPADLDRLEARGD